MESGRTPASSATSSSGVSSTSTAFAPVVTAVPPVSGCQEYNLVRFTLQPSKGFHAWEAKGAGYLTTSKRRQDLAPLLEGPGEEK